MRHWSLAFVALTLAACAAPQQGATAPADPIAALRPYVLSVRDLPVAPAGPALPSSDTVLTTIAFGSCQTAQQPIPILDRIVAERPQLMVYMGDNVYGDAWAGDMALPELRTQYALMAGREEFQRLRAAAPMLATWDDHDLGWNDGGGDFSGRQMAQRIFESFWRVEGRFAGRDGIWDARVFGPEGRRVQFILLDTRSGRTPLTRLPQSTPNGRYALSEDPDQRMLSDAQWQWLEAQLREPADIRFIVSSIQVLADGHAWEAWRLMPREQARLYETVRRSGAKGVVFISGDRHLAALYRQDGLIGYPAYELTTSSLNLSFRDVNEEMSSNQIGPTFAPINYGMARIDWDARALALQVVDGQGAVVREQRVAFGEIGL
ncbi:MAG: alkaline phosphatase family protein [Hyphomonadaceae bacterium]|nr:alkaline phosphatase family protein [Hyphomonadaceae bacterium]